jgi:hypothetical protein
LTRHGSALQVKVDTEEEIKKLGLDYTFIATGPLVEWFFSAETGFDHKSGKVFSLGNIKVSSTHTNDVAKVTSFQVITYLSIVCS